jgi:hypothetical protein
LNEGVGNGCTTTVALPDCDWEQAVELASTTDVKVYTNKPAIVVGTVIVAVFPEPVTVCTGPLLMVYENV